MRFRSLLQTFKVRVVAGCDEMCSTFETDRSRLRTGENLPGTYLGFGKSLFEKSLPFLDEKISSPPIFFFKETPSPLSYFSILYFIETR